MAKQMMDGMIVLIVWNEREQQHFLPVDYLSSKYMFLTIDDQIKFSRHVAANTHSIFQPLVTRNAGILSFNQLQL